MPFLVPLRARHSAAALNALPTTPAPANYGGHRQPCAAVRRRRGADGDAPRRRYVVPSLFGAPPQKLSRSGRQDDGAAPVNVKTAQPRRLPSAAARGGRRRASLVSNPVSQGRFSTPLTLGSSPRVRGTRNRDHRNRAVERFIPACAGNSRPLPRGRRAPSVHPRVCGELHTQRQPSRSNTGSSPRSGGRRPRRCEGRLEPKRRRRFNG